MLHIGIRSSMNWKRMNHARKPSSAFEQTRLPLERDYTTSLRPLHGWWSCSSAAATLPSPRLIFGAFVCDEKSPVLRGPYRFSTIHRSVILYKTSYLGRKTHIVRRTVNMATTVDKIKAIEDEVGSRPVHIRKASPLTIDCRWPRPRRTRRLRFIWVGSEGSAGLGSVADGVVKVN